MERRRGRRTRLPHRNPRRLPFVAMVLVAFTLASCADDQTERRFANEPLPTVSLAEDPAAPTKAAASPVPSAPGPAVVSPEALLVARGAPRSFYVSAAGRLLVFTTDEPAPTEVLTADDGVIHAVSASPNGDRVAALVASDSEYHVLILSAAGEELHRFESLQEVLPVGATPVAGATVGRDLVDWSPQGDRVLVAFAAGGIVTIPLDGEPAVAVSPDQAAAPLDAEWSPAGDAIAFVSRPPETSGAGLFLVDTDESGVQAVELVPAPANGGASVVAMAWHPNGRSVLYTRTGQTGNATLGGDLFQYTLGSGPRLLASSGRGGPVAGISTFAPSPDGRSVAYVIAIPSADGPAFHSLWVRQIGTDSQLRLPTPAGMAVTDLWWTAAGLVMEAVPGRALAGEPEPAGFGLYLASPNDVSPVYEDLPAATPAAEPAASPVPSPAASPSRGN
ncbi:MAG: hypothetical protein ACRDJH_19640 [Thermomicrobiales bacterium]